MTKDKYEVGYKKPPHETQWEKGRSGNPKGRPKGSNKKYVADNLSKKFISFMGEEVFVKTNGETQKLAHIDIIIRKLMKSAADGNTSSIKFIIDQYSKFLSLEEKKILQKSKQNKINVVYADADDKFL